VISFLLLKKNWIDFINLSVPGSSALNTSIQLKGAKRINSLEYFRITDK
jgi:hypothetical protein